jgi:glycosyltransferase 2 family protein
MSSPMWTWARPVGGLAILAALAWRFGTEPFVDALRLTSVPALLAALVITAVTTLCCAWRWSLVAGRLGVHVGVGPAGTAYYRSQFLNATLPAGVLGDVHRAVRHGRDVDDLGGSARSVIWDRGAGQAVQVTLTVLVLLALPSPFRSPLLLLGPVLVIGLGGALLVAGAATRGGSASTRVLRTAAGDLRRILLAPGVRLGVLAASALAAAGHALVFVIAARTTGVTISTGRLVPLALVVLLAATIPMNLAGWGPREGVAAWAFATAGLGAEQGMTVAVVYGLLALVATAPGALILVLDRRRGRDRPVPGAHRPPATAEPREAATHA